MIALSNISKQYGQKVLYDSADFQIKPGEKIGLVGPNGAGKTSLFRIIVKEEGIDSGTISIPDRTIIGYFSQTIGDMKGSSALDYVKSQAGRVSKIGDELKLLEAKLEKADELDPDEMQSVLEKYGELQTEYEQRGGYDLDSRAKAILTGLGIGPDQYDRPLHAFSGGWKMRIALAGILALQPDVLLMDEPTNHLDLESIVWLEEWLQNFKGSLVMTSHDREFMNRIVSRIVEVSFKKITSYTGDYDFYERERDIRKEQLLAAHKKQNDMLAKEEEFIARFAARASHAAQVQSRVKKLEKIERIEIPTEDRAMKFEFTPPPRSGDQAVKIVNAGKVYPLENGKEKRVFKGASAVVRRMDKVVVVGVNGAGKSTLLKCITGETNPTEGEVSIGSNVRVGYFSQHALDVLNPRKTIFEEIHDRIPDATIGFVRNLLGAFLFSGDDVEKKVGVLSGGEKSRVLLATILATPVNLLVLDEPTNHLDMKSREVLLQAIKDFEGTVLMVSHDRHFLRKVSNRVFELDTGELRIYEGNYDYYLEKKGKKV